jgi:hypothetical protein
MASIRKTDLVIVSILAFDFLLALPAGKYPLWTVHSGWFRTWLYTASLIGAISAIALPVWVGIRLFRKPAGRRLVFVEFLGVLCWLAAFVYVVVSEFPVI